LPGEGNGLTRDEKATNLVMNYSTILVFAFEDAFANLASAMSEALVKGTAAMSEALGEGLGGTKDGPKPGKKATEGLAGRVKTGTSKQVREAFSEMREKARGEIRLDDESLKELIRAPAFDRGIEIVRRYEFGLPKLTERLGDADFAAYVALYKKSDPQFTKMSAELSEWRESLPNPKKTRRIGSS
jgi:hypothetical protein